MEEINHNFLKNVFVVWFLLLTVMAGINFYKNLRDEDFQVEQNKYMETTKIETQEALAEHQFLRERIIYLEGYMDAVNGKKAAFTQPNPSQ